MAKIFISYRHMGGAAMGQLLSDRLKAKHHSVFFDRDSLVAGKYPDKIYEAIEKCDCLLLILPEKALDRCLTDPEDWVRREIRHALQKKKPVIPILLRGFSYPKELPEDIAEITEYHGVSFEKMESFEENMKTLFRVLPRTGIRKWLFNVGSFFTTLGKGFASLVTKLIRTVLEKSWQWKPVRYALLFFLGMAVLANSVAVVRYFDNANVNQWIQPMTLYRDNVHTVSIPISPDNKRIALYDGNGQIVLSKVEGNTLDSGALGVLETSFRDRPAMVGFLDNKYCCVVCEGEVEIFDTDRSGEPVKKLEFSDYDPEYFVETMYFEDGFSTFAALWTSKETGELSSCSIYDENLTRVKTFPMEDCRFLGSAASWRYLLFWDADAQQVLVIDSKSQTQGTLETMGEGCYEQIDQTYSSHWSFDKLGRYVVCHYPSWNDPYQTRVAVLDLKTGNEVYSGDYWYSGGASFDSENSFVIFHQGPDGQMELRRVRFLEENDAYEVLITEEELLDLLEREENIFPQHTFNFYLFPDSDYMLAAYDQRLHLIDMEGKRRMASCNPLVTDSEFIVDYTFLEVRDNIITVMMTADTLPEDAFDFDWMNSQKQTAVRFSFHREDGKIVINEDAYEGEWLFFSEVFWLVLSVAGLVIFLRVGRKLKNKSFC